MGDEDYNKGFLDAVYVLLSEMADCLTDSEFDEMVEKIKKRKRLKQSKLIFQKTTSEKK